MARKTPAEILHNPNAWTLTREERAVVAIEALDAPEREPKRKIFEFDGRRRPGVSVSEFL